MGSWGFKTGAEEVSRVEILVCKNRGDATGIYSLPKVASQMVETTFLPNS